MKTWILDEEYDTANAAKMRDVITDTLAVHAVQLRDVITATLAVHAVQPVRPVMDLDDELAALKAENRRLRAALGAIANGTKEYPWLPRSEINRFAVAALPESGVAK